MIGMFQLLYLEFYKLEKQMAKEFFKNSSQDLQFHKCTHIALGAVALVLAAAAQCSKLGSVRRL